MPNVLNLINENSNGNIEKCKHKCTTKKLNTSFAMNKIVKNSKQSEYNNVM